MIAHTKKRVVSGKRSTGELHLGHYWGALKNWISLQSTHECFFFAADWHALTTDYDDTSHIQKYILSNVSDWLALGIDPARSTIFIQSCVKEHAELYLLLSMITPVGWLERNPTYKDQIKELTTKDLAQLGFLGYPVLQTADILIYKGEFVPVGEDQLPHLELCREITRRFNFLYGNIFLEPKPMLTQTPKIAGTDGRKMSNSYHNCIYFSDASKIVGSKIMTMMTDPARQRRDDKGNPDICPVFLLHKLYTDESKIKNIIDPGCRTAKIGCVDCKKILLEKLLPWHEGIFEKRNSYLSQPKVLTEILREGQEHAKNEAQKTISAVREALKL